MGLMTHHYNSIRKDYIKFFDVVKTLRKTSPDDKPCEIGLFLGFINIEEALPVYSLNDYCQLINDQYTVNIAYSFIADLSKIPIFISDEELDQIIFKLQLQYEKAYWKKSDFFNFKPIKELNLPEGQEWLPRLKISKKPPEPITPVSGSYSINRTSEIKYKEKYEEAVVEINQIKNQMTELRKQIGAKKLLVNLELKPPVISAIANISYSAEVMHEKIAKIDKLETENDQLKAHIAELESQQKIITHKYQAIDCLFNSEHDSYAPDLAHAINLWIATYSKDQLKQDSHNNRANTWIRNNTQYSGDQEDTATRRIREITTPLNDWHASRKKLIDNN